MKRILYALCLAALMVAAACSKDKEGNTWIERPEGYDNLRDSVGIAQRPVDWVVRSAVDPTNVQTVIITSEELPTTVDGDDLMAAFTGNVCRAVAEPVEEANGKVAFTLVIEGLIDEVAGDPVDVELRYYSKHNSRIYVARKFRFRPGEMLGSLNTGGYRAEWK